MIRWALAASVLLAGSLAGCKALPPPPMVAFHGDTTAAPRGTTSAMLVFGTAGEILGGDAWGVAVRVEHQQTTRTTVGVELTGGRSDEGVDEDGSRLWMGALRLYGRSTPREHDFVALTYGGGISVLDAGLVTLTGHGGGAISYPNDYVAPFLQLSGAFALVVRKGRKIGDHTPYVCMWCEHNSGSSDPPEPARSDFFVIVDTGVVGLIGDTGNRLSLDLAWAAALRADELVIAMTIADAQRETDE